MMMNEHDKEFAYRLYSLSIGECTYYNGIRFFRVPGGWITETVFIPWNNEFQTEAFKPTDKSINLVCKDCNASFITKQKEIFQGNTYQCPSCKKEIKYES